MKIHGLRHQTFVQGNMALLTPAVKNPGIISSAVGALTDADFLAARGNPNVPTEYANTKSAYDKLNNLTKFGFRYAVQFNLGYGPLYDAGMVSLMDLNVSPAQSVLRKIGLDTHSSRTINGWLNMPTNVGAKVSPEDASTETIDSLARAARNKNVGLKALEVAVMEELPGKNPDLIVIEHTADLESLGFKEVGSVNFSDQKQDFTDGVTWRLEL